MLSSGPISWVIRHVFTSQNRHVSARKMFVGLIPEINLSIAEVLKGKLARLVLKIYIKDPE